MDTQTDELSLALRQMQDNLKKVSDEHSERIWLQSNKNTLSDKLRGDKSLQEISRNVIEYLASFCDAQLGAFYIPGKEKDTYLLQYSYGIKGPVTTTFRTGEGLVGQTAAEHRLRIISSVPDSYFHIESSLGRMTPPGDRHPSRILWEQGPRDHRTGEIWGIHAPANTLTGRDSRTHRRRRQFPSCQERPRRPRPPARRERKRAEQPDNRHQPVQRSRRI